MNTDNNNGGGAVDEEQQELPLPPLEDLQEKDIISSRDRLRQRDTSIDFANYDEDADSLSIKAATTYKNEGNFHFKDQDYAAAIASYREGVDSIKDLVEDFLASVRPIDENENGQVENSTVALLVTLYTNLSTSYFKIGKRREALEAASEALSIDPLHIKARFRRAVTYRKLGETDLATRDLKFALREDPSNTSVRKELASLQKEVKRLKANEKAKLRKAFSESGESFLQDDRVEDEQTKKARLEKEMKAEHEALQKKRTLSDAVHEMKAEHTNGNEEGSDGDCNQSNNNDPASNTTTTSSSTTANANSSNVDDANKVSNASANQIPLWLVAKYDNYEYMKELLEEMEYCCGLDDSVDEASGDRTALHWAVYNGNEKMVKLLLDPPPFRNGTPRKPADPSKMDADRFFPLWIAARDNRFEILKLLLDLGNANPNQRVADNENGNTTPLFIAVVRNNSKIVEMLLNHKDCDPNLQETRNNMTPLDMAEMLGHTKIHRMLLLKGGMSIPQGGGCTICPSPQANDQFGSMFSPRRNRVTRSPREA